MCRFLEAQVFAENGLDLLPSELSAAGEEGDFEVAGVETPSEVGKAIENGDPGDGEVYPAAPRSVVFIDS